MIAIVIEIVLAIAAFIAIVSYFTPKEKDDTETQVNDWGLYECEMTFDGEKIKIVTEVELLREYDSEEVLVRHVRKIHTVAKFALRIDSELNNHTILKKSDIRWEKKEKT